MASSLNGIRVRGIPGRGCSGEVGLSRAAASTQVPRLNQAEYSKLHRSEKVRLLARDIGHTFLF